MRVSDDSKLLRMVIFSVLAGYLFETLEMRSALL